MQLAFSSIAIVGAGAVGTYYGVRLAKAGADVSFLLRGDFDAVRTKGAMTIDDGKKRIELRPVAVFDSTKAIGPVDLVIVALKTTANRQLRELLPPLIGANTAVLTLQNGIGSDDFIASVVGAERVMGGLAFIAATRTGPGEVKCYHHGSITLGEFGRPLMPRTHALAMQFQNAGVELRVTDKLAEARWRKLVWNIPFNGLAIAGGGITTDRICADGTLAARVRLLMKEVQTAATALGHEISDEHLQQQFEVTPGMGAYQPSSLVDYLAGREVEIEAIWGEPLRRAQAAGAAVPEMGRIYDEVRRVVAR